MGERIVRVSVSPGARKERFKECAPGEFEASVKEKPERGEATRRVRMLLSLHFGVPISSVTCRTGIQSRRKTFVIH